MASLFRTLRYQLRRRPGPGGMHVSLERNLRAEDRYLLCFFLPGLLPERLWQISVTRH